MRKIAMGFAALLVLGSTVQAAPAEDEAAKKSPGFTEKIKSDARGFGRGMKKGATDVGHQIAKGAKRTADGFRQATKHPAKPKSQRPIEPESKREKSASEN